MKVSEPIRIGSAVDVQWDGETDALVVGFGGAGVVAALEAREDGVDVFAIDRFAGGGATAFSGGVIYTGATEQQKDAGFEDTADAMFNYLRAENVPLAFTLGGLVVDEDTGKVVGTDGRPIEGLHAAGRAAVGLCSEGYMSGLSIADMVFSGRRAARCAVRQRAAERAILEA